MSKTLFKTQFVRIKAFIRDVLMKVREALPNDLKFILFKPPKKVISTKEYCKEKSFPYNIVIPESKFIREPPETPDASIHWKFQGNCDFTSRKTWTAEIPEACVVSREAHVLTSERYLLYDASIQLGLKNQADHSLFVDYITIPKIRHLAGTSTILSGPSARGYFHWLMDALPRLNIILKAGYSIDDIDHFLIPKNKLPAIRETLELLDISPDKLVYLDYRSNIHTNSLIVPSMPGKSGSPPPWVRTFLRKHFLSKADDVSKKLPKRFYISRKKNRRIINEEELLPVFNKYEIQTIQPEKLTFKEQVALFSNAELIIAPHGAALTNLVFSPETTSVIELFSPSYVNICYWVIANLGNLRYSYIIGSGERLPSGVDPHKVREDIHCPVDELQSWIETQI